MTDEDFMDLAIAMAEQCRPNDPSIPKVGCCIAIDGKLIAFDKRGAEEHAEKVTIAEAREKRADLTNATVYTTLEPCTHHTRREAGESCAERICLAHVKKVWIGTLDPNQDVRGRGVLMLQDAGIEVALFPDHLVKKINASNEEFITAQKRLGLKLTRPVPSSDGKPFEVKAGRHELQGTFVSRPQPGELHVLVGNDAGKWWPQHFQLNYGVEDEKTWSVQVDLHNPGRYSVAIVRANALGNALIKYFAQIRELRTDRRKALAEELKKLGDPMKNDPGLTKALGTDWTGIDLGGSLPKGLDRQLIVDFVST